MIENIFYLDIFNNIGGTEHFLFELSKKYNFVLLYDFTKSEEQIKRLEKNGITCIKRDKNKPYFCKRVFHNIFYSPLENVYREEDYLIGHTKFGKYKDMLPTARPYEPYIPDGINLIGVSKNSTDTIMSYSIEKGLNLKPETIYNPISNVEKKPFKLIVSSCRLEDKNKGADLMMRFVKEMDKYCEKSGDRYLLIIFSNEDGCMYPEFKNLIFMKPRLDVEQFIANADLVLQLSTNMETYCYTTNQALLYGTPVIITPNEVYDELGIDDSMSIRVEYDGSNLEEVVEQVFNKKFNFKYKPPKDNWSKYLEKKK